MAHNFARSRHLFLLLALGLQLAVRSQTSGPNNPSAAINDPSFGTNAWSVPGNVFTSNDSWTTVATRGITNLLRASDFGFSIPGPGLVTGIQLDVERSTFAPQDVALLDGWTSGLTKTISAGANRCLIVIYAQENGNNSRDITAMTYGGRPMTQVIEHVAGVVNGFNARLEAWMLLEADITLAASTAIVPTYGGYTPLEYCETFSAAVFQHVDQLIPVISQQGSGAQGTNNPHQLSAAITTIPGSVAVNVATCGNNTVPGVSNGGTNTYTINSGFTEGTDIYFANVTDAPNTGACLQTAHKAVAAGGTEQPQCTFNGGVNRFALIGFTLQRAREIDQLVQLVQGGSVGGTDQASPQAWPNTDTYMTYGGPLDLWGRSWTLADINNAGFGAAMAVRVQNGTARVDHMRLTVYVSSTQPIELIDFRGAQVDGRVQLDWITGSEQDNDHFIIQRSPNGLDFQEIASVPGAGNSASTRFYNFLDEQPADGINYYRLQQVDIDGTMEDLGTVAVEVTRTGLTVFPNPTTGTVTVYDQAAATGRVGVYDQDMRLIRTHYLNGTDPIVHLGDLPDGSYLLMVHTAEGIHSSRVLKVSCDR